MAKAKNITIPRAFLGQDVWNKDSRFSKVDAYVWLSMMDAEDKLPSYREIAETWQWSHTSVVRFIKSCIASGFLTDVTLNVTKKSRNDGVQAQAVVTTDVTSADSGKDLFERCWIEYRRKGNKKKAREMWERLSPEERRSVLPHIRAYIDSREIQFQKDFERYLRDKIFESVVFKNNAIIYDPAHIKNSGLYTPSGFGIWRDQETGEYHSWANFYGSLTDGYDDSDRPDGAKIVLNNARGTIVWSKEQQKWNKL